MLRYDLITPAIILPLRNLSLVVPKVNKDGLAAAKPSDEPLRKGETRKPDIHHDKIIEIGDARCLLQSVAVGLPR